MHIQTLRNKIREVIGVEYLNEFDTYIKDKDWPTELDSESFSNPLWILVNHMGIRTLTYDRLIDQT